MKRAFAAVFLLAVTFAAVAVAQEELICESPLAWYAHTMRLDPAQGYASFGRFYYDENNLRVARHEEDRSNGTDNLYGEIFLHIEKKGYQFNLKTQECRSFTLTEDFPKIGPYSSDKFDGDYYIGSSAKPKDGVEVNVYSGSSDRGRYRGVWIPMVDKQCLPESLASFRESDKTFRMERFYDVRLGIFDYSVFTPPDYCSQ